MTPSELLSFLQEFHRETLALMNARQARSRIVSGYDANNGYQQVLGRQEVHLRWLSDAIAELGGQPADVQESSASPKDAAAAIAADAEEQKAFIHRWSPRIDLVTNARHRKMLWLILGEMAEHLRVFEQAGEGRTDVLGRHSDGKILRGAVLPVRPKN